MEKQNFCALVPERYSVFPRIFPRNMKMLVAGDTNLAVLSLRSHFLQKGCEVETAYTSDEIRKKLSMTHFDILISSFLSSDEYALRLLEITRRSSDVRLLFLTGKKDVQFNIKALNLGADDCLSSPASFFELDARVLRLCRRNSKLGFRETKILLRQGENTVEVDMSLQTVKKNGAHVILTKMEYKLLLCLALNKGKIVFKEDLEKLLSRDAPALGHSLNTHIFNLRRKTRPALSIKTASCRGFVLE
jgi:DNA-binding response OmpR family regulator